MTHIRSRRRFDLPTVLVAFLAILFLLSLVPIYEGLGYSRMTMDDYSGTYEKWTTIPRTVGAVLSIAWANMQNSYQNWMGSYATTFLGGFMRATFATHLYPWAPYLIFSFMLLSFGAFFWVFLHRALGLSSKAAVGVGLIMLLACVQFVPNAYEAFVWYAGASYYTVFFCAALWFLILIRASARRRRGRPVNLVYWVALPVVGFFIAGGNYAVTLTLLLIAGGWVLYGLVTKRRADAVAVFALAAMLVGLAINVVAPGNSVRQSYYTDTPDAPHAILYAVGDAARFASQWLTVPLVGMLLLALPFCWAAARKCSFSFRLPVLVTVLSLGLLAVGFAPSEYAQGSSGPPRLWNTQYFLFILLLFGNAFYYAGWLLKAMARTEADTGAPGYLDGLDRTLRRAMPWYALLCIATVTLFLLLLPATATTTGSAIDSLLSGELKGYAAQCDARMADYLDPNQPDLEVTTLQYLPPLVAGKELGYLELSGTYNAMLSNYFQKNSITFVKAQ